MEIRILAGRIFAPDEADAIVISQRLARAMYGNGNVLGEGFPKSAPKSTVVGRVASAISAGIGGLTLVLACLGIFGVVSYGVALRTKEIGIHMALGASRPSVLRLVMRQVLSPVGIGVAIGLVAAIAAGVALSGDPFYVRSVDPIAYLIALLVFGLAAALSALTPALKALHADPIRSLRHD